MIALLYRNDELPDENFELDLLSAKIYTNKQIDSNTQCIDNSDCYNNQICLNNLCKHCYPGCTNSCISEFSISSNSSLCNMNTNCSVLSNPNKLYDGEHQLCDINYLNIFLFTNNIIKFDITNNYNYINNNYSTTIGFWLYLSDIDSISNNTDNGYFSINVKNIFKIKLSSTNISSITIDMYYINDNLIINSVDIPYAKGTWIHIKGAMTATTSKIIITSVDKFTGVKSIISDNLQSHTINLYTLFKNIYLQVLLGSQESGNVPYAIIKYLAVYNDYYLPEFEN